MESALKPDIPLLTEAPLLALELLLAAEPAPGPEPLEFACCYFLMMVYLSLL